MPTKLPPMGSRTSDPPPLASLHQSPGQSPSSSALPSRASTPAIGAGGKPSPTGASGFGPRVGTAPPLLFPRDFLAKRAQINAINQNRGRKSNLISQLGGKGGGGGEEEALPAPRAFTPGFASRAMEKDALPPRSESTDPRWARLPETDGGSPSRARSAASGGEGRASAAAGHLISGEGHLQNALELVVGIMGRLLKEGKVMTDIEQDLVSKVGKSASLINAKAKLGSSSMFFTFDRLDGVPQPRQASAASISLNDTVESVGRSGGAAEGNPLLFKFQPTDLTVESAADSMRNLGNSTGSEMFAAGNQSMSFQMEDKTSLSPTSALNGSFKRPNSSQRTLGLLSKLRNVTATSGVYKKLIESKSSLESISEFALAAVGATSAPDVADLLLKQVNNSMADINATVFVVDPVHDIIYNPLNTSSDRLIVKMSDTKHPLQRAAHGKEFFISGSTGYLPVTMDGAKAPLCILEIKNPAVLEKNDGVKLQRLEALSGIAALSFRNIRLIERVKWQVEKAEAMLTMANQLSRDNLDESILMRSIITTARELTESDRCSVFLVRGENLQAYFEDGTSVKMPLTQGIAGHVATTGEILNITDAYENARFNKAVDKATGYRTKTMLCLPVRYEGTIVAVAQLVNKLPKTGEMTFERDFTDRDQELFLTFSTFIGVCLRNCRVNMELKKEKMKSETVLDVVTTLANSDIREVDSVVSQMMHGAKQIVNADRATLFLIDKEHSELYSKLADSTAGQEIRFPIGTGIAGTVAQSGIAESIPDAYNDDRFNKGFDKLLGYRTKSILCEPIHCRGELLAVAQLVNKLDDEDNMTVTPFEAADSETFRTFAMFAGISLSNAALLNFAVQAGREAMHLSGFEAGAKRPGSPTRSISRKEIAAIWAVEMPTWLQDVSAIQSNEFNLFLLREGGDARGVTPHKDCALLVIVSLIMSTGLPEKFGCDQDTLLAFVWNCRKRYRTVPYHNFWHAVDVCQTIHTFLYEGQVKDFLTDVEIFTLFITALAHDLDHMGVNNSFHMKTDSPLGMLSSASGNNSVLEVHHCNIAIEILEDPAAGVFKHMDNPDKSAAYKCLIDTILATDMARHGDLVTQFTEMATDKTFNKENPDHRKLVCQMVMKAADISNVTKPFLVSRLWAISVTEEFYQQGDKEKDQGVDVLPMFDRSKAGELANGQISFINFIAKKFYETLVPLFTGMQWTVDRIGDNVTMWTAVAKERRSSLARLGLNTDGSKALSPRRIASFAARDPDEETEEITHTVADSPCGSVNITTATTLHLQGGETSITSRPCTAANSSSSRPGDSTSSGPGMGNSQRSAGGGGVSPTSINLSPRATPSLALSPLAGAQE